MLESVKQMIWTCAFHLPEQVGFVSSCRAYLKRGSTAANMPLLAMTSIICADNDALPNGAEIQLPALLAHRYVHGLQLNVDHIICHPIEACAEIKTWMHKGAVFMAFGTRREYKCLDIDAA